MKQKSLIDRIIDAYKQAVIFLLAAIAYSIVALIVFGIGISLSLASLMDAFENGTGTINGSTMMFGLLLAFAGFVLIIVGIFAAFIFSATRSESKNPIGFFEAYVVTFKLILELALIVVASIIILLVGAKIGGGIGVLFALIGMILLLLFPFASMFYVFNYLLSR